MTVLYELRLLVSLYWLLTAYITLSCTDYSLLLHSRCEKSHLTHLASHVLGETAGNDDHIVSNVSHQLDAQVDHSTQRRLHTHIISEMTYTVSTYSAQQHTHRCDITCNQIIRHDKGSVHTDDTCLSLGSITLAHTSALTRDGEVTWTVNTLNNGAKSKVNHNDSHLSTETALSLQRTLQLLRSCRSAHPATRANTVN